VTLIVRQSSRSTPRRPRCDRRRADRERAGGDRFACYRPASGRAGSGRSAEVRMRQADNLSLVPSHSLFRKYQVIPPFPLPYPDTSPGKTNKRRRLVPLESTIANAREFARIIANVVRVQPQLIAQRVERSDDRSATIDRHVATTRLHSREFATIASDSRPTLAQPSTRISGGIVSVSPAGHFQPSD